MSGEKKVKVRKKSHLTGVVFWICFLLLAVPVGILGWILLSSQQDSGAPVLGNRYDGDLDPAIHKTQLEQVEAAVQSIDGVESTFVTMPTATLRVYADIRDYDNAESANWIADQIYGKIASVLEPSVYFTQHDGKKMYDLEVHVYTTDNGESDNFVYVIGTKTSSMEGMVNQVVSEPVDAEVAQKLRDSLNPQPEPEEGGDIVGGVDVQLDENGNPIEDNGENGESGENGGE